VAGDAVGGEVGIGIGAGIGVNGNSEMSGLQPTFNYAIICAVLIPRSSLH